MDTFEFPPYLKEGDKVTIISPSGPIDTYFLKEAAKRLESWGLNVILSRYAGGSCGRFSGTEKQRVADLQQALDDPEVRLIFCSRGGYGAVHLMDKLDFTRFRESPKWLAGYSDITLLHELFQYEGFASLHGPMARHLAVEPEDDRSIRHFKEILFGKLPDYRCEPHRLNRPGKAEGILRGGNLAVLCGIRGTRYDLTPQGTLLFIEDIGERPYQIDRMMYNLRLGGILENISGLIIGQFTEYEEDPSMGKEVYERIAELVEIYGYPAPCKPIGISDIIS